MICILKKNYILFNILFLKKPRKNVINQKYGRFKLFE